MSRLHLNGAFNEISGKDGELSSDVIIQPDLLVSMRESLRDLMLVSQFPSLHRNNRRRDHTFQNERTLHKRELSDELLRKQRAREEAGLLGGNLPMHAMKDEVLSMVQNNTYSILVAETGAGKSTQLPQFLLEKSIADGVGAECRIFCIQPRRIAAASLARRVSAERGEKLGETVGYKVRFDSQVMQTSGSITYCTTGIMLQLLQNSPSFLDSVSYILLDEVHERQIDLDLLMLYLKRAIKSRRARGERIPNIVVMSATLDVDLFASYFENKAPDGQFIPAPNIRVPGRSFPVQKHYLDDFLGRLTDVYSPGVLSIFLQELHTKRYLERYGLFPGSQLEEKELGQEDVAAESELPEIESPELLEVVEALDAGPGAGPATEPVPEPTEPVPESTETVSESTETATESTPEPAETAEPAESAESAETTKSTAARLKSEQAPNESEETRSEGEELFDEERPEAEAEIEPEPLALDEDHYVPTNLIGLAIGYVLSTSTEGAILVFLPGLRYLIDAEKFLLENGSLLGLDFADKDRFKIMQLHSSLPEGQMELFSELQPGCRRIILATTIAETSVTIPDVKYVIDSGKLHQSVYEPRSRLSRMVCRWTSQSSIHQRAGRAGRLRNGEYFGVFPRSVQEQLRITALPELKMADLQRTALAVKKANPRFSVRSVLQQAIEPPLNVQIKHAVDNLQALRAMDEEENITVLGHLLSDLPVDPSYGKLILLGIVFRCLDPLLIIGALGADLPLFHLSASQEARKEMKQMRMKYAEDTWSDHVSVLNAFRDVREAYYQTGNAMGYAMSRHIHWSRFREAMHICRQILTVLAQSGLIPKQNVLHDPQYRFGGADLNVNAAHTSLVKALLLHTLYPNMAAPTLRKRNSYRTPVDLNIEVASSSVNFVQPKCLIAYNLKKRPTTGAPMLLHTTHVSPLAACLFGGRLQGSRNQLRMDEFQDFSVRVVGGSIEDHDNATRVLINFRKALDMVLFAPFQ